MCCLFGLIDTCGYFNKRQKNTILSVLSAECEVRGTDATGIAYNTNGALKIFKRALPASRMWYSTPHDVNVIMGHTRMTTQGTESKNYNNHPFYGTAGSAAFALAHNGVLHNDAVIRKDKKLPETKIQTDSYIAVQLLEKEESLTFDSLAKMAETVRGSFAFTVLDNTDNLYFVKGDNPLCIYHFVNRGFYLYASTKTIADKAILRLGLDKMKHEDIPIRCGDILRVDKAGKISTAHFDTSGIYSCYNGYFAPYSYSFFEMERQPDAEHIQIIRDMAGAFGYAPEIVDGLLEDGFTPDEIEGFFYDGEIV